MFDTSIIAKQNGVGPLDPKEGCRGYIEITNDAEIVDACFSVDGTAIAIACANGVVKFLQVDSVFLLNFQQADMLFFSYICLIVKK